MKYKRFTIRLFVGFVLALSLALTVTLAMGPFVVGQATPPVTLYANNRPGWESAVLSYDEEFFTDAILNPGISVISTYPGYVDTVNGVWWDRLACPTFGFGKTTTTWVFSSPIVAFGGNWNPNVPGGPGAGISVAINGSWVVVGEIPNYYTDQFWGFVSDVPFTQVRLEPGSGCGLFSPYIAETYTLDNMIYSQKQPPVADPNGPYSGLEGSPIDLDGTGSYDPYGYPLTYSWSVDSGLCTFDDASSVTPNLTCTDNGSYTVTLEVSDGYATDSDTATVEVTNVAPLLLNVSVTSPINENDFATLTGDIFDPGTSDSFTLDVNWGDGSAVESFAYPAGQTSFSEMHQYLDDNPSGTPFDDYTISLTFSDDDGGVAANEIYQFVHQTGIDWLSARDAAALLMYQGCPGHLVTITSQEEQDTLFGLFGRDLDLAWFGGFQDPGVTPADAGWQWVTGEPWSYTNWAPGEPNDDSGPASEQYLHGWWYGEKWNDTTLIDLAPSGYVVEYDCFGPLELTITVNNIAPQLQNVAVTSPIFENDFATLSGEIIDPGTLDTFTLEVDWGDDSSDTYFYTAGTTSFSETHQYLDDDPTGTPSDEYAISLTLTDDDGGRASWGSLAWEADYGTGLNQADDDCDLVDINFEFVFYGTSYSQVWVNSNGNITFNGCNGLGSYLHTNIPDEEFVIAAPLYGDFNPAEYGDVYYNMVGTAPYRRFVATWVVVPEYFEFGSFYNTFQVQLIESSNAIQFGYNGLTTDGINWIGSNMNVGISSGTGAYINSASGTAIPTLDYTNICYQPSDGSYVEIFGSCQPELQVTVNNVAPVVYAGPDQTIDEGNIASIAATYSDGGTLDTHTATIDWGDGSSVESATASSGAVSGSHLYEDDGTYTVQVCVTDDDTAETCDILDFTVDNVAPVVEASSSTQTVQYSDFITPVTFTATDIDADPMVAATTPDPLPDNLTLTDNGCIVSSGERTCTWTLSGTIDQPVGDYPITLTVTDDDDGAGAATSTITVDHEDADIWLDSDNLVDLEVDSPEGDSPAFYLTAYVKETDPDAAAYGADPGDINYAEVEMTLSAVGPGSSYTVLCTPVGVTGTGYDAVLEVSCAFDDVEVNTYHVQASVVGDYYRGGPDENVLVVFDPSLGFTTGGGWFYWPGTEEKTNFGYVMKYNKKGTNVKGSLLIIRHVAPGEKYRIKSNALDGLAIGDGGGFGWASFSGKATYLEPGWPEPIGNHSFIVYVEDHGQGGDQFWIEVHDKDDNVIAEISLDRDADDNAVEIEGGNIVVPH